VWVVGLVVCVIYFFIGVVFNAWQKSAAAQLFISDKEC